VKPEHFTDLHLNVGQWLIGAIVAGLLCIPLAWHRVDSDAYWNLWNLIGWGFAIVLVGIVVRGLLTGDIRLHG
jgi:hypothetical protein